MFSIFFIPCASHLSIFCGRSQTFWCGCLEYSIVEFIIFIFYSLLNGIFIELFIFKILSTFFFYQIVMAHLCIVGSHVVNGVSELHTHTLKSQMSVT